VNRFLHELLDLTPAAMLTIFFCKVHIILLLADGCKVTFSCVELCRPEQVNALRQTIPNPRNPTESLIEN